MKGETASQHQQFGGVEPGTHKLGDALVHLWGTTDPNLGNRVLALRQIALEQLLETGCHESKPQTLFVLLRKVSAELYGDAHAA